MEAPSSSARFVLAGVFSILVPASLLNGPRRGKIRSVLWASAIGTPGRSAPAASAHRARPRRQGATPGATVAFLITTPEVGIRLDR